MGNILRRRKKKLDKQEKSRLLNIPIHLVLKILSNVNYEDYVNFAQTCRVSYNASSFLNKKLPEKVYEIVINERHEIYICRKKYDEEVLMDSEMLDLPIRFNAQHLVLEFDVSDADCDYMVKKLMETQTKVAEIKFIRNVRCSDEKFTLLFQTSGANSVYFHEDVPSSILALPILQNINKISITRTLTDPEFLQISAKSLRLKGYFQLLTLHIYLQEWIDGKRDIEEATITARTLIFAPHFKTVLIGLNPTILWTPATHGHLPMPPCPGWVPDFAHVYQLHRKDGETIYIKFSPKFLEITLDTPKNWITQDSSALGSYI